jgi:WD40 repeat protein
MLATGNSDIAPGSSSGTIRLWDARTGSLRHSLPGRGGKVYALAFSPDGKTLAAAVENGTALLWDVQTARLLRTFRGHYGPVLALAFSPNGRVLATGGEMFRGYNNSQYPETKSYLAGGDGVKLWDTRSGKLLHLLSGQKEGIADVAFSPDGKQLASAAWDSTVKLWDAQSGKLLRTWTNTQPPTQPAWREGTMWSVAFSPDGKLVAGGSFDQTIKLWDAADGKMLRSLTGHHGTVQALVFTTDGDSLISSSPDRTIRRWRIK